MIDIGRVEAIDVFAGQKIIAVLLDEVADLKLNIGQKVIIGEQNTAVIRGWKLWPERSVLDLIVDDETDEIVVGERIQVTDNRLT